MTEEKREGLSQIIDQFPGKRVLVVGDVMLDEYIWGKVRRISPEAPVPVVEVKEKTFMAGGAGNSAANIAVLGGEVKITGVIGDDPQATLFCEKLNMLGVDTSGLTKDPGHSTITKTRIIANKQHVVRVDIEKREPLSDQVEESLLQAIQEQIHWAQVVVISDYGKHVVSKKVAQKTIKMATAEGLPVVIDPKGNNYEKYIGATVITPNVMEAEMVLNCELNSESEILEAGKSLNQLIHGKAILLTRGSEGMTLFHNGGETITIPAVARNLFDVTGAGDTVVATLAICLAAGATMEDGVYLANLAAGLVVEKLGTATVTCDELRKSILDDERY